MAAACAASESGKKVAVLDECGLPGGQIWRGGAAVDRLSANWFDRFRRSTADVRIGSRVVAADVDSRQLTVETPGESYQIGFQSLVVATGARERFLPFPGWTLPNVMGAGALQAFVKSGLSIRNKRVVVAGSGPLLLAVAAYLSKNGAKVRLVAEQAASGALAGFGIHLLRRPEKARAGLALKLALWNVPYRTGCWVTAASGSASVAEVELQNGSRRWTEPCDFLAIGYGLVANTELAASLGCQLSADGVVVDQWQQTTVSGIFCAGEITLVGGVDLSLLEGEIAGYAASGKTEEAHALLKSRDTERRFAAALKKGFALNPRLKNLPSPGTLVCRCEDVSYMALQRYGDWRSAKLQTRCGMGPCQGRICGAAAEFLFGWRADSVRPPIMPARIDTLTRR